MIVDTSPNHNAPHIPRLTNRYTPKRSNRIATAFVLFWAAVCLGYVGWHCYQLWERRAALVQPAPIAVTFNRVDGLGADDRRTVLHPGSSGK